MAKQEHAVRQVVVAGSRCSCGWSFYNLRLRGKDDEALILEAYAEFEKHKSVFDKKKP